MPFLLADRRDTALLVSGAENGMRTYTRDARRALAFENGDKARTWAGAHLLANEYEASVLLNRRAVLAQQSRHEAAHLFSGPGAA